MEQSKTPEKYQLVRLPHDPWREAGERLILRPGVLETGTRFCLWRLEEQEGDEGSGIMLFRGPPGTGKSVFARSTVDAVVRHTGGWGNTLIVHTPALFSEELGRSAKLIAEFFSAVEFSAAHHKTFCIWDDAEGIFVSREQAIAAKDPTDLLKVTAALNDGFDRLRGVRNVVHIATANLAGVIDPSLVDRIDYVVPFALPTFQERVEIIRRRVNGLVGELLLAELAAATEGWSGRQLAKLVMRAYLLGTARTRKELTPEDFLRAVRRMHGHGHEETHGNGNGQGAPPPTAETTAVIAEEMVEEAAMVAATVTNGKEEVCQNGQNSSCNGYQQAPLRPQTRSDTPLSWLERLQRCSTWPPLPPC